MASFYCQENNIEPLMAWFEVDIFESTVIVDLHDYSLKTAIIVVREKIKEAYEHGFRNIRFIHGATHIKEKTDGGSIKFALHSMFKRGEFAKWIQDKDSGNHKVLDGSITFALRKNPAPVDSEWKELPMREY
jgi:hypothetical protein